MATISDPSNKCTSIHSGIVTLAKIVRTRAADVRIDFVVDGQWFSAVGTSDHLQDFKRFQKLALGHGAWPDLLAAKPTERAVAWQKMVAAAMKRGMKGSS